jgi:hypothetical protein
MRMPTSSSVILATLASSASLGALVSAAPTPDGQDSGAVAPAPGNDAAPAGADAITGILSGFGASSCLPSPFTADTSSGARDAEIERRQLDGIVDTAANMLPFLDAVLGALGLQRKDAMGATSVLPLDTLSQIESLVKQAVPIPGAVGGTVGGVVNSTAPKATRADRSWTQDRPNHGQAPTDGGELPMGVQLNALPLPVPVQPPVSPPAAGNSSAGSPAPPKDNGPGAPPASSPFSPPLPANPPNTPMAMSSPPLFSGASANGTEACGAPATSSA